jgi:D-threonate/D-erythronate kinase
MPQMLILADDLSGAADCAAACIGSGLSAYVVLGDPEPGPGSGVLSIDCNTRHLESEAAADRVAQLLYHHTVDERFLLFKKLDSTLRGPIGAELAAILKVRRDLSSNEDRVVAVMAPAFPAQGRVTIDGHQFVHGKLLDASETWRHQRSSDQTHIPSMIAIAGMKPALVGLELIRSGEDPLREMMKRLSVHTDVLVCDAETDKDLRLIAEASRTLGRETVWAGSAGLAYHLPRSMGLASSTSSLNLRGFCSGPTLIVIGSMSEMSREQVTILGKASNNAVFCIHPKILLEGPRSPHWQQYARKLDLTFQVGQDVTVSLEACQQLGHADGRILSRALSTLMAPFASRVGALVASGGETARSILEAWGISSLRVVGEFEPGMPLLVTEGWSRALPVLTKAGAFGDPETLVRSWKFLSTLDRDAGK